MRTSADYGSRNGATSSANADRAARLITLSYILAIAMPPLGLALGIAIWLRLGRSRSRHGVWIIVASVLAGLVWVLIISSGALTATDNSY